ncbi:MAG: RNA methyltransferase [Bacteroidia bacterium]|nr:RNA methyltransferase [Bacteroidia bacterium]
MPLLPHPPKFYEQLQQTAHRQATGLYLAPGRKLLVEALRSLPHEAFHAILVGTRSFLSEIPLDLRDKTFVVPDWQLSRISGQESPDGVVVILHQPPTLSVPSPPPAAVIAEGLQDPGNVGTLLRTMEWLGWKTLWLSKNGVDPFHPRVVRASMGSIFRVQVQRVDNWLQLLQAYEGRCVVASVEGASPADIDWSCYDSLYLGGEARGVLEAPLHWPKVAIPASAVSRADSLNVTIAAGILLFLQRELRAGRLRI